MRTTNPILLFVCFAALTGIAGPPDREFPTSPNKITRLSVCTPDRHIYNLAADRAHLGSVGQRFHDLLISDKEIAQLLTAISDHKVFDWQPMTAVSPFPTNHVVLLVYGADPTGKDCFQCSIGNPKTAVEPLTKLIQPLDGEAREILNRVVGKMKDSE